MKCYMIVVFAMLACAGFGESAQMKRAKEFINVYEFESARTELKVQLHNQPDDQHAKALLLFMLLAEGEGTHDTLGATRCMSLPPSPTTNSTLAEEKQKETRLGIRKYELEKGITTKDWEEYRQVLDEAVTFGWSQYDFSEENQTSKLVFSFCAAMRGDKTGIDYLVDHLASDKTRTQSQWYLYLIGDPAIERLSAVANSPENLAQKTAAQTLQQLRLATLIKQLSAEYANRVSPSTVRIEGGKGTNGGKYLMSIGWRDDNQILKQILDAAKVRESIIQDQNNINHDDTPVIFRQATSGGTDLIFATVALPSDTNATGSLQPAGINTTFLTKAWRWSGDNWVAITIDGKPSISGSDLALLFIDSSTNYSSNAITVASDQLALVFYRGIQTRSEMVNMGWYGYRERVVNTRRVDWVLYHAGPTGIEKVKVMNTEGVEVDENGSTIIENSENYGD